MVSSGIGDPHSGGRHFLDDPIVILRRQLPTVLIKTTSWGYKLNATAHVLFHLLPVHVSRDLSHLFYEEGPPGCKSSGVMLQEGASSADGRTQHHPERNAPERPDHYHRGHAARAL